MTRLVRRDHYLENRQRLEGQPKRVIADYVERNGVLVPRRFRTLDEVKAARIKVIARSEHEREYDGVSGLLESPKLGDTTELDDTSRHFLERGSIADGTPPVHLVDDADLKQRALTKSETHATRYCQLLGIDKSKFEAEVSYSYWELLGGVNRTVVADSSIPSRYHVMTAYEHKSSYTVVDNGVVSDYATSPLRPLTPELRAGLTRLIELYETIRNLDHFDPNHCPIMEFQTVDGKDYFLQYHRTRDFSPATFELTKDKADGEIEAFFARGATQSQGRIYRTPIIPPRETIPLVEDGSIDYYGVDLMFSELAVRRRTLQFVPNEGRRTPYNTLSDVSDGHECRSKLFKPEMSLLVHLNELVTKAEWDQAADEMYNHERITFVDFFVISDGRRAFFRRINE